MNTIVNPHAMFFENVFSRLDIAADFIKNYLPSHIVNNLDLSTVQLERKSFINNQLKGSQSDLLYKIKTIDNKLLFIYILLEHKSYIDRWVLFQLLGYIVQIGDRERMINKVKRKRKREENKANNRPENEGIETEYLTPVIPIIVYHGPEHWECSKYLSELYKGNDLYKEFLPDFNFLVINLKNYDESQIKGIVYLQVALLVMKYFFSDELFNKLPDILSLLADLVQQKSTIDFLSIVLEYIGTNQRCDEDFLKESLDKAFENKGEEIMHTLADKLVNKYSLADKWIDKGKREGKKEGKTQLLSFLFEERFGNVPQQLTKQINQADDKLIEDLTRSFLRFQSINDYYLWREKHYSA
ncbi:MAG: transposase YhgA family protein [Candidatus Magnetoglobus multicellularis str. Araruama]|uniref:Transposase YhgA family protein n=1 Tax=Candidatus Magnetoglobus multicellularis str. Araruama TaxID=890399 RepID=A0A1V1PES2_9BACT|nr:MAG: transposase YhgA family protein [Candidatus Magnetoglobus multicellularis str. Araruama]